MVAALLVCALVVAALASVGGLPAARRFTLGTAGEYRFLDRTSDGRPYRWDPCVPIHYEVNPANAPPGALADVREAVARVGSATGLRFTFDGTTTRTIEQQMGRSFQSGVPNAPRWLPVLVAWLPHEHFVDLAETRRAAAFALPRTGDGQTYATYESGVIAVDAGIGLSQGFDDRFSDGVVLMHEWGHIVGLAHVASGAEVMYSPDVAGAADAPDAFLDDWGPGDRRGLEVLGQHGPCGAAAD